MTTSSNTSTPPETPKPLPVSEVPSSASNPVSCDSTTFDQNGIREECDLRPVSERMADPRLIATMAMKEIHDALKRYTTIARDLHSDLIPVMTTARSSMIHTYREEFPELMALMGAGDFDHAANETFLESFTANTEYLENIKAGDILALFTPWLKPIPKCRRARAGRAPPPTPYPSDREDDDDNA